jgi:hypothetical protein
MIRLLQLSSRLIDAPRQAMSRFFFTTREALIVVVALIFRDASCAWFLIQDSYPCLIAMRNVSDFGSLMANSLPRLSFLIFFEFVNTPE